MTRRVRISRVAQYKSLLNFEFKYESKESFRRTLKISLLFDYAWVFSYISYGIAFNSKRSFPSKFMLHKQPIR